MGKSSVFASLVKGLTWTKIASLAVEHGPDLYRRARERFQPAPEPAPAPAVSAETDELKARLAKLESVLLEQEEIIRTQVTKNQNLEKNCRELETSLKLMQITAGALTLGCIVLLAIIFK